MATAIDPICKMDVDTDNPTGGQSEHDGTTYYFCAPGCRVAFDKEPEKYLSEAESAGHDDHEGHGHDHGDHGNHGDHEGHDDHSDHEDHEGHEDHGHDDHDHGPGGHSHGHHMPEREEAAAPANKPGFFARLFGKK